MKRAYNPKELLDMKREIIELRDEWKAFLGSPEFGGTWFIWGNSGNGKTSFVLQLCRALCDFAPVVFNSLEEGTALTMARSIERAGLMEVGSRFKLVDGESMEDLSERLLKRKSPRVVVIDSLQYCGMNYREYIRFSRKHPAKLIIFVSHADGNQPAGRAAKSIMYDASLKVFVEGYKAFSKGRYIGPTGEYVVWKEGADRYWGEEEKNNE